MYILLLLASVAFLFLKTIYSNIQKRKKFGNLPPGPSKWPMLGSLPEQTKNTPAYKWIAKIMKQLESDIELFFPSDNPANIAEWAIAQMINQPKIMQEAMEEIDKVVGKERLIQETDVPQMNYLKACVKECLRLHPVSPFVIPHAATSDSTLAGYFIPKGSHVLLYRSLIGRDPNVWDDPTSFKPSRYLQDSGAKINVREPSLNFIGFGAGRRGCPAIQLGVDMTIVLLGRLLQGFTWKAPSNEKIDLSEAYNGQLTLAQPLHALATPRLPAATYVTLV